MDVASLIRPRRSLAMPFFVACYPLLGIVVGETELYGVGRPITDTLPFVLGGIAAALVVSYTVAVLIDALVWPDPSNLPAWARSLVEPTVDVIALVSALTVGLVAYLAMSSLGLALPPWLEPFAKAIGMLVGLPIGLAVVLQYLIGGAYIPFQSWTTVHQLLVLAGAALSGVWIFVVANRARTLVVGLFRAPIDDTT